jgi:hypothetical protein
MLHSFLLSHSHLPAPVVPPLFAASVGIPRQLVVTSDPASVPELVAGVGLKLPLGEASAALTAAGHCLPGVKHHAHSANSSCDACLDAKDSLCIAYGLVEGK